MSGFSFLGKQWKRANKSINSGSAEQDRETCHGRELIHMPCHVRTSQFFAVSAIRVSAMSRRSFCLLQQQLLPTQTRGRGVEGVFGSALESSSAASPSQSQHSMDQALAASDGAAGVTTTAPALDIWPQSGTSASSGTVARGHVAALFIGAANVQQHGEERTQVDQRTVVQHQQSVPERRHCYFRRRLYGRDCK